MKPAALEWSMKADSSVTLARREAILSGLHAQRGVPKIMGIINVTTDSFYEGSRALQPEDAVQRAIEMWQDGATWIDIGGESTRPGAEPVDEATEASRVVPVIKALREIKPMGLISIDTRHAFVATAALNAGADMINDISGLRDPEMVRVVLEHGCAVCIMHMQGEPGTMQQEPHYTDCVSEVSQYLEQQRQMLVQWGHDNSLICLDPGIGFGKTHEHNLELLRTGRGILQESTQSLLWGASRKRLIGHLTKQEDTENRLSGTLGVAAVAFEQGIDLLRVHDVRAHADLFATMEAVR